MEVTSVSSLLAAGCWLSAPVVVTPFAPRPGSHAWSPVHTFAVPESDSTAAPVYQPALHSSSQALTTIWMESQKVADRTQQSGTRAWGNLLSPAQRSCHARAIDVGTVVKL